MKAVLFCYSIYHAEFSKYLKFHWNPLQDSKKYGTPNYHANFYKKTSGGNNCPFDIHFLTSLGSHVFMSMKLILITLRRFTQFGMINWTMEVGFCWFQKYENLLILRDIVKMSITNSGMWNRGWHSKAQFCLLQFWRKVSLRDAYTFNDFPFIPRWPFYVKIVFPAGVLKLP